MRLVMQPIGELVDPCRLWTPAEGQGSFSYIDLSSVDKDLKAITQVDEHPCSAAPSRARQLVACGDVLVATVRPNLNGVAVIEPRHDGMTASTGYCVLRPRRNVLDSRYLFHWVRTPQFVSAMVRVATGATYPAVSDAKVKDSLIPLRPIADQKHIALILDAAEMVRANRRATIGQLDGLAHSQFQKMFGDPITNPQRWPKKALGQMMRIRRGGSPRPIEKFLGGTVNWVKISDATHGDDDLYITSCADTITTAGLSKTTLLEPGSFIFANSGVSLGFARILKIHGAIHDGWLAFDEYSTDELSPLFFLKALNSITHYFRRVAPAGTQPNLNTALMKVFELIVPPIDLQREFAAIVESIESHKARLKTQHAELDALFASLQVQAFNGELCSTHISRQHASA